VLATLAKMKTTRVVLIALLLLPTCARVRPASTAFVLAADGRARCCIVIEGERSAAREALAKELQFWLREITGATIPLGETQGVNGAIVLAAGHTALGPEGFAVRSGRRRLSLVANTDLGLQHAVYALLEHVGCRWFFPDPVWTVVPKEPNLAVSVDLRASPAFGYRRIWYGWGPRTKKLADDYHAWMKRNRQLGAFQTDCGHAWERYVPAREFEKHPELFGLVKGERKPLQLCTSNPDVEKRIIEGVLARFRKEPGLNMVSVDPNDGAGYCECERCAALGSVSDRVFLLASNVAKAVRNQFPDKWVGLYAYAFHCEPPRTPFAPGVYVQVTTGFRYTKLSFDDQVTAFRKLGARLGVYDYFSVYPWDWDMPGKAKASRVYELAQAIRHYRDLGLSTYDAESGCNWGPNGLGYWLAARLMWDPEADPKALVGDFCERAFGRAAEPMRRLYERWASGEKFAPQGLRLALLDLQQAYKQETEPSVRARLDRVAMYLHWLRLSLDYDRVARGGGAPRAGERSDALQQAARELIVFSRRLMDTGLIHAYPMLSSEWFQRRFAALLKLKDFDPKQAEAWKTERTDIPSAEETARLFAADLEATQPAN